MLLADGTLHCGMYPTGKVAISQHLVTPRFPRCDQTVRKLSADTGSLCSIARPPDLKSTSTVSLPFAWITGHATDPAAQFDLKTSQPMLP